MKKLAIASLLCVVFAGCATQGMGDQYRPIVDMKGHDYNQYEQDLGECQRYAAQTAGAAPSAVGGAIVGALFGAILAKAAGSNYDWQGTSRVGAVAGAAGGAAQGEMNQRNIIRQCLAGRGYSVLQ